MVDQRSGGDESELAAAKASLQHLARDHARIPFSWSDSKNAGFSESTPWMRANDDTAVCNAKQQQTDKASVLSFWKRMLQLRRQYADIFVHGDFDIQDMENPSLFKFTKTWQNRKAFVVLNFSGEAQQLDLASEVGTQKPSLLVSSADSSQEKELAAYEGRIYLL